MPRHADYTKLVEDKVAQNRRLYATSAKERLRRINYTRAREGRPLAASLDECKLVKPMEAR